MASCSRLSLVQFNHPFLITISFLCLRHLLAISGLMKIDFGAPLASTASRARGYDMGLIAILEKPEDVATYAQHPAHLE